MSKIEWTEQTWNPVTGCTKVSQGCKNCYAEGVANRFWGKRKFTDIQCHQNRLDIPLKRKKSTMYFVNSMSDLFHDDVPDHFIDQVFGVMMLSYYVGRCLSHDCDHENCQSVRPPPKHIFQILSKRPERMARYINGLTKERIFDGASCVWQFNTNFDIQLPLPNVWLGVSVEDQETANERIPLLLQTSAAIRWLSMEPLLDAVNLNNIPSMAFRGADGIPKMHVAKMINRWLRRCILISAFDKCVLDNPYDNRGGSFTGASIPIPTNYPEEKWPVHFDKIVVSLFIESTDELPHHYLAHIRAASQILGYKHPDPKIRECWLNVYHRMADDWHMLPESEEMMDKRLGDNEDDWREAGDRNSCGRNCK